MSRLPDGWHDMPLDAERWEAEMQAAFRWPMRIVVGVAVVLLAVATWVVM